MRACMQAGKQDAIVDLSSAISAGTSDVSILKDDLDEVEQRLRPDDEDEEGEESGSGAGDDDGSKEALALEGRCVLVAAV